LIYEQRAKRLFDPYYIAIKDEINSQLPKEKQIKWMDLYNRVVKLFEEWKNTKFIEPFINGLILYNKELEFKILFPLIRHLLNEYQANIAARESINILRFLNDNGISPNQGAFYFAISGNNLATLKFLESIGISYIPNHQDMNEAFYKGDLKIIKYLLGLGAQINTTNIIQGIMSNKNLIDILNFLESQGLLNNIEWKYISNESLYQNNIELTKWLLVRKIQPEIEQIYYVQTLNTNSFPGKYNEILKLI